MRPPKVTDQQIEEVCRTLLEGHRRVGVRDVMRRLRALYGSGGRTERVAAVLSRVMAERPVVGRPTPSPDEFEDLRGKLKGALERAALAEQREIQHQDYWARRYAERLEELERAHASQLSTATRTASERYLRLYQWAAELTNRLRRYEVVEPPAVEIKTGG